MSDDKAQKECWAARKLKQFFAWLDEVLSGQEKRKEDIKAWSAVHMCEKD